MLTFEKIYYYSFFIFYFLMFLLRLWVGWGIDGNRRKPTETDRHRRKNGRQYRREPDAMGSACFTKKGGCLELWSTCGNSGRVLPAPAQDREGAGADPEGGEGVARHDTDGAEAHGVRRGPAVGPVVGDGGRTAEGIPRRNGGSCCQPGM